MKPQFVDKLVLGEKVDSQFSVKYKHPVREYGKPFKGFMFAVGLADRTGEIELTYWGGNDKSKVQRIYDSFKENDVVSVSGIVGKFKDNLKIDVNEGTGKLERSEKFEIEDFIPSAKNLAQNEKEFSEINNSIKNEFLKRLLDLFFTDNDFFEKFRKAPAAMYVHQAYLGGLLEHTLNVAKICGFLHSLYPGMDRDLLVASALLHDIGKTKEFHVTTNIKQTEEGMLRGHITIGEEMVMEKIRQIMDFPETLKIKIAHIMLSHHGDLENGSPKEPHFSEAIAVYYADEFDSKLAQWTKIIEEAETEDFRIFSKRLGQIYLK